MDVASLAVDVMSLSDERKGHALEAYKHQLNTWLAFDAGLRAHTIPFHLKQGLADAMIWLEKETLHPRSQAELKWQRSMRARRARLARGVDSRLPVSLDGINELQERLTRTVRQTVGIKNFRFLTTALRRYYLAAKPHFAALT